MNFYNLPHKKGTAANIVLAKCGVKYKIENVEIFIRRCFVVLILFLI